MADPIRRSITLGGIVLAAALVIGFVLKLQKPGTGVGSDPAGDSGSVRVVQSSGGFAPAALAWSPDSKQIATLNMNGLVSVWDAGSGYCLQRIAVGMSSGLPREIKFSPGGTFIATRGVGAVSVVEWRGARIIKPDVADIRRLEFQDDETLTLYTRSRPIDPVLVVEYELATGAVTNEREQIGDGDDDSSGREIVAVDGRSWVPSPDGKLLVTYAKRTFRDPIARGIIADARTGKEIRSFGELIPFH